MYVVMRLMLLLFFESDVGYGCDVQTFKVVQLSRLGYMVK